MLALLYSFPFVISQPSKEKLESIYHEIQKALIDQDRSKLNQVLEALSPENILKSATASDEAYAIKKDLRSNDMSDDPYSGETEKEDQSRTTSDARKSLEAFLKHFTDNVPDPIVSAYDFKSSADTNGVSLTFNLRRGVKFLLKF